MKHTRSLVPILLCALASGCVLNAISGSGKIVTEPRSVSGFSGISLNGTGRLLIERTGTESLTVTADDNLLPEIRTEVHGDRLEIGLKDFATNIRPSANIIYKVTVKDLRNLGVSGSGTADAKGLQTGRLKIDISGSGKVSADGTADDLEIDISGSGAFRGDALRSKRAEIDISGSGSAVVAVAEKLDVDVSGSGSVSYIGDPQVKKNISGSGSVRKQ
jgi:hypothetical protein